MPRIRRRIMYYSKDLPSRLPNYLLHLTQPPKTKLYQAMRARKPLGHVLTQYLRASSSSNSPMPKAIGKNQCSTGTAAVSSTRVKTCGYSQRKAMASANSIAGKRYQFCVCLLKSGGCWKMDRRRVRTQRRLNHCLVSTSAKCNQEQIHQSRCRCSSRVGTTYMTTRFTK